ncbi:extracellular solute-binding protein [Streptomyces sp. NPDC056405]|uniref:extracellular solute-binding protein n=1 Tax=Streptomyces sp. NPDC056405 TaxID=3345811 RepID=UPI0035D9B1C5
MTILRGMAWDHPRGVGALRAVSAEYSRRRPDVSLVWYARSLRDFEDASIAELAASFDLVALDHPFMGQVHEQEALIPLERVLPKSVLADREAASTGPSFASYRWAQSQWALPIDAAAQVSAYRWDLLADRGAGQSEPRTWDEMYAVLKELGPERVILPANSTHLLCSLLTLCAQQAGDDFWFGPGGVEESVGVPALARLTELLALAAPESLTTDPIQALESMSRDDRFVCAPLVFGYITYARADRPVGFRPVPSADGSARVGLLGGVGLGISARSRDVGEAAAFLDFVTGEDCQRRLFTEAGGQPAHRGAWTDPAVNVQCGDFLRDTLPALDSAFVRPRHAWYPLVHQRAGSELHRLVRQGAGPRDAVRRFNEICAAIYRDGPA